MLSVADITYASKINEKRCVVPAITDVYVGDCSDPDTFGKNYADSVGCSCGYQTDYGSPWYICTPPNAEIDHNGLAITASFVAGYYQNDTYLYCNGEPDTVHGDSDGPTRGCTCLHNDFTVDFQDVNNNNSNIGAPIVSLPNNYQTLSLTITFSNYPTRSVSKTYYGTSTSSAQQYTTGHSTVASTVIGLGHISLSSPTQTGNVNAFTSTIGSNLYSTPLQSLAAVSAYTSNSYQTALNLMQTVMLIGIVALVTCMQISS